jgi:hypothetical protein
MFSKKSKFLLIFSFLALVGSFYFFAFDFSWGAEEASLSVPPTAGDPLTSSDPSALNSVAADTNSSASSSLNVGGLLIPSTLNKKGIEFLTLLKGKGIFPIILDPGTVGKENIFKK